LTSSAVANFDVANFRPDVFGGALAEGDLVVHLVADLVHVVVHHGKRHANGENGYYGKSDGRIGHEPVGLDPVFGFHL